MASRWLFSNHQLPQSFHTLLSNNLKLKIFFLEIQYHFGKVDCKFLKIATSVYFDEVQMPYTSENIGWLSNAFTILSKVSNLFLIELIFK